MKMTNESEEGEVHNVEKGWDGDAGILSSYIRIYSVIYDSG